MYYRMNIAGVERDLPLCKVNDELYIAGFVILGDPEMSGKAAGALLEKVPAHDIMITAEAKGIPLAHEMARQEGNRKYLVARKASKLYIPDPVTVRVRSITTDHEQQLVLDKSEMELMRGKRVLIVDDVVSTGGSVRAISELVKQAGGEVVGCACILAEGKATEYPGIIYLEELPLFNSKGEVIED